MAKDRKRISTEAGPSLRHSLAGLAGLRERLPSDEAAPHPHDAGAAGQAPRATPVPSRSTVFDRAPRLVVRRERKGHGGKTATRIEGLVGSTRELDDAVRDVKRALGCGATRDGSDVVVQGDQGERLLAFLSARGARKVVVGS